MESLFSNAPKVIRAAATSPLALMAFVVLLIGGIALAFFAGESANIKVAVFLSILLAGGLFIALLFRLTGAEAGSEAAVPAGPEETDRPEAETESPARRGPRENIRVRLVRSGSPVPSPLPAQVFEEDTCLVLSASKEVSGTPAPPQESLSQMDDTYPKRAGSLIVREGDPLRMLAVVHDLELDPSWKESWISEAVAKVFTELDERGVGGVLMPFLGTRFGALPPQRFVQLLREALEETRARSTIRVWVQLPGDADGLDTSPLASWLEE